MVNPALSGDIPPEGDTGASVWRYAATVLRHRRLVVGLPIVLAVVVGVLSLIGKRQYVAYGSFQAEGGQSPLAGLGQLASQFGLVASRTSAASPQFYADLLTSREILREVLLTRYDVTGSEPFRGTMLEYYQIRRPSPAVALADGMRALKNDFSASTDRITGVVSFQVFTRNPGLSGAVAERYLALLNDFNLRQRQSRGRDERAFVAEQLDTVAASLREAEEALSGFYARNRRIQDSPELVAQEQRFQRQVSFRQQVYTTLAQSLETAKLEEVRNTPVITVIEHPGGFVEPRPRYTVLKVAVTLVAGFFFSVLLALGAELVRREWRNPDQDVAAFETERGAAARELRALLPWRRRQRGPNGPR